MRLNCGQSGDKQRAITAGYPEMTLYLRDDAITDNPGLVAGMKKYFDLIWE